MSTASLYLAFLKEREHQAFITRRVMKADTKILFIPVEGEHLDYENASNSLESVVSDTPHDKVALVATYKLVGIKRYKHQVLEVK